MLRLSAPRRTACCVLFALAAHCGVPPEGAGTARDPGPAPGADYVLRTVVHLRGDAPAEVDERWISPAEARAEDAAREQRAARDLAADTAVRAADDTAGPARPAAAEAGDDRVAQAIATDPGCAGSSLFLQSATGQAGSRLCFYGSGRARLEDYCVRYGTFCRPFGPCLTYCMQSWAGSVRSYWGGNDPSGRLEHFNTDPAAGGTADCAEHFLRYRKQDVALACGQRANYVSLGSDPWGETFGWTTTIPASDPNAPSLYLDAPRADGSVARLFPTSADTSVSLPFSGSATLVAVADNPGGVQRLEISGEVTTRCSLGGDLASVSYGFVVAASSDDTGVAGGTCSTRRTVRYTVNPGSASCNVTSISWGLSARARNYAGVEVNTARVYYGSTP